MKKGIHLSVFSCIALHCFALHCIALHCLALHCVSLDISLRQSTNIRKTPQWVMTGVVHVFMKDFDPYFKALKKCKANIIENRKVDLPLKGGSKNSLLSCHSHWKRLNQAITSTHFPPTKQESVLFILESSVQTFFFRNFNVALHSILTLSDNDVITC